MRDLMFSIPYSNEYLVYFLGNYGGTTICFINVAQFRKVFGFFQFKGYYISTECVFQRFRCIKCHDLTMIDNSDPVAQMVCLFHIMCCENDSNAFIFIQSFYIFPDMVPGLRVKTERGFIKE